MAASHTPRGALAAPPRSSRHRVLRSRLLPALLIAAAALAAADAARAEPIRNGFDLAGASVPVEAIQRGGPPKDGIPAIDAPRFVAASRAGLADGDRVLGIVVGGQARAYPVRILNWHEVVNDRWQDRGTAPNGGDAAAERGVVVTYCPLCGTGMAFDTGRGADRATFGVSGLLYNSDVLLYDRRTGSLWSQIMKTAISGPLKGSRLAPLPTEHTSWADWRARHPGTVVLSTETGYARDYARDPYAGYAAVDRLMFDVSHRDERHPPKEWVLGVTVGDTAKAYPFSVLARAVDARGEVRDTVAGRTLRIRYDAHHATARVVDAAGAEVPSVMAYWFAWVAFHPQTEVLQAR